jgi:hypothetical protein
MAHLRALRTAGFTVIRSKMNVDPESVELEDKESGLEVVDLTDDELHHVGGSHGGIIYLDPP